MILVVEILRVILRYVIAAGCMLSCEVRKSSPRAPMPPVNFDGARERVGIGVGIDVSK